MEHKFTHLRDEETDDLRYLAPPTFSNKELAAADGVYEMMNLVHRTAINAGWYPEGKTRNIGEVIALMHSELSEALEADRKDLMDSHLTHRRGIEVELADCVIRIFDTAKSLGLDIGGAMIEKNRYNQTREDHKMENRNKSNGKKY